MRLVRLAGFVKVIGLVGVVGEKEELTPLALSSQLGVWSDSGEACVQASGRKKFQTKLLPSSTTVSRYNGN